MVNAAVCVHMTHMFSLKLDKPLCLEESKAAKQKSHHAWPNFQKVSFNFSKKKIELKDVCVL